MQNRSLEMVLAHYDHKMSWSDWRRYEWRLQHSSSNDPCQLVQYVLHLEERGHGPLSLQELLENFSLKYVPWIIMEGRLCAEGTQFMMGLEPEKRILS